MLTASAQYIGHRPNITFDADAQNQRAAHYCDAEGVWQTARDRGMRRVLDNLDATQKERPVSLFTERMKPHRRDDGYSLRATALLAVANR